MKRQPPGTPISLTHVQAPSSLNKGVSFPVPFSTFTCMVCVRVWCVLTWCVWVHVSIYGVYICRSLMLIPPYLFIEPVSLS